MSPESEKYIKNRYWELMPKEDYPDTPEITKELDNIENVLKIEKCDLVPPLSLPSPS